MEKSQENNMIDIVAQLERMSDEKLRQYNNKRKNNNPLIYKVIIPAVLIIVLCSMAYVVLNPLKVDFSPYYAGNNRLMIVSAIYKGSHASSYSYDLMVDDEIVPAQSHGTVYDFDIQDVYYKNISLNEYLKSTYDESEFNGNNNNGNNNEITIETSFDYDFRSNTEYLLFIYKGGDYIADFYPVDSPKESVKKQSPYYILQPENTRIIEKTSTGYRTEDGTVSESELKKLLKELLQ